MSRISNQATLWEEDRYQTVLYSGCSGLGMNLIHRHLERNFTQNDFFSTCLEIGADSGQHQKYVRHRYNSYISIDLRPNKNAPSSFVRANTENLPFGNDSIDRLISTCVLHHLTNPEAALDEWRRVTKPGGNITFILAADPGFVHRMARWLTTVRYRDGNYDHALEMAREHRNHAWALIRQVRHIFNDDQVLVGGIPFPVATWNFNLTLSFRIVKSAG